MLPELRTEVPGPRSRQLAGRLRACESRNVTMVTEGWPIFWERAEGVNVWDADGNRFLDFTSGFGVAGLGHSAAPVRAALTDQAARLLHAMGDVHPAESKVALCEMLGEMTYGHWGGGRGKVILGNSGSDAIEAALKTAVLHSGKPGVLVFEGAYHGLGYGALEASALGFFRSPFASQLGRFAVAVPYPYCYRCPFGHGGGFALEGGEFPNCSSACLGDLRQRIVAELRRREIGAILVEPVQGRGGEVVPPRDFLRLLRRICDEEKILLIADEIYTGFNRTGRLFACDHSGVVPDIVCLGKALTSGFPLSACVGRADVKDAWPESTRGRNRPARRCTPARFSAIRSVAPWRWPRCANTPSRRRRKKSAPPDATSAKLAAKSARRRSATSAAPVCCSGSNWSKRTAPPTRKPPRIA